MLCTGRFEAGGEASCLFEEPNVYNEAAAAALARRGCVRLCARAETTAASAPAPFVNVYLAGAAGLPAE